jgi:serine protein kinase
MADIFKNYKNKFDARKQEVFTIQEYLNKCKKDPMVYAPAAERMLAAIGEPEIIDTSSDPRLSRIFSNKTIKRYAPFKDFYGMETVIEQIVSYFSHSSQFLEERKQVLYLLGPVGSAKSSIAETLKHLMEQMPIYCLALEKNGRLEISPVFETPLGLFNKEDFGEDLLKEYNIPTRMLSGLLSPWAVKRLREDLDGDISKFKVVKLVPSKLDQIAIAKVEPGDENNSDISALVGKVDIRKLNEFSQDDPDCYSFSGGLCRANQGLLEFVEMFKSPIKLLHPLLTATQEGNYNGTEALSAIPFGGIILAHSNEAEWQTFRNNKSNEAFLDRIYIVKVPYCMRVNDEIKIYEKLLNNSSLKESPCTPKTLEMMAQMSVLSRLVKPENSSLFSKMKVYDGEPMKDVDPHAKSLMEYRDFAGIDEGMNGLSTRFAFKVLSKVFNYSDEIGANPVHLLVCLENSIIKEQFPKEREEELIGYMNEYLKPKYAEFLGKELQRFYLEAYSDYGQNMFEKYIIYSDHWVDDKDYKDETGILMDRAALNDALTTIEKPSGIGNPKEFRGEVVSFCLRYQARNNGKFPAWNSYEKLKIVIEKKIFNSTEEIMPIISFSTKANSEDEKKHNDFVQRMIDAGYTKSQIKLLVDWFGRVRKSI